MMNQLRTKSSIDQESSGEPESLAAAYAAQSGPSRAGIDSCDTSVSPAGLAPEVGLIRLRLTPLGADLSVSLSRCARLELRSPSYLIRQPVRLAPEVGFEPTTNRLTADRSTAELLRNSRWQVG